MERGNKTLLMFIGKTHSGKTTFAEELKNVVKDTLILEADPIAVFMKEKFPELRKADDKEHSGAFNNASLKFRTFLSFLEFTLSLGRPIILSNSNMWQNGREMVLNLCKKFKYKVVGVYFDFPEELLLSRVRDSNRSTNVLRVSKDFKDLVINQRARMQPPLPSEFDEFFLVKSEKELDELKNKLLDFLR